MKASDETPKALRKEQEQALHRAAIVDAAMNIFAENGYYQTTMQMIAEKAEFSVGYLYKHFSGKEEMYKDMVEYHMERMDEIIVDTKKLELSPLSRLRLIYDQVSDHFNKHPDFMRIYHLEIGGEFAEALECRSQHFEEMVETLQEARDCGEIRECDPRIITAAIQGATKELFREMAQKKQKNPFDDLTEVLFSLLIDPLRPNS